MKTINPCNNYFLLKYRILSFPFSTISTDTSISSAQSVSHAVSFKEECDCGRNHICSSEPGAAGGPGCGWIWIRFNKSRTCVCGRNCNMRRMHPGAYRNHCGPIRSDAHVSIILILYFKLGILMVDNYNAKLRSHFKCAVNAFRSVSMHYYLGIWAIIYLSWSGQLVIRTALKVPPINYIGMGEI